MLELPDGARIRGRSLRLDPLPDPAPERALYLLGTRPAPPTWKHRWVRWPDWWLPRDAEDAIAALAEAHRHAGEGRRIEVACRGRRGRTGTALACIAQLAGVPAGESVAFVREHYDPRAVETPWQRRFVAAFAASDARARHR